eukprot:4547851-Amphidinium_carterae.1
MVYPEAPFRLGPHLRVSRHEDFLQCLDCNRITGKVRGEYNIAYLTKQDCRKLDKVKKKPRFYGFRSALRGTPSTASAPSPGGAQGSAAAAAEEAP